MKLSLLTPALAAIVGLALASAPVTVNAQTPAPAPASEKAKAPHFNGTVTAVDAKSISVQTKTGTVTLAVASTTTVKNDKKPATITDIAVGDKVNGTYDDSTKTATTINKGAAKAKGDKKKKK